MDKNNQNTNSLRTFYNSVANARDFWKKKSAFYHEELARFYKFTISKNKKVIEIGCGTGDLLASLKPSYGVGIDIAEKMLNQAVKKYPKLHFMRGDAQNLPISETFDYVVASDLVGNLNDVQTAFSQFRKVSDEKTRIIITYYNYLWELPLTLAEKIGLKMPQPKQNWLSRNDIESLLNLADLEVIKSGAFLLFPLKIPILSDLFNRFMAKFPLISHLCLVQYTIARLKPNYYSDKEYSVSVVIPARNEKGNIEQAVIRTPKLGSSTELIFVEGHSTDGTYEEIKRVAKKYRNTKSIHYFKSPIKGKGNAVRIGFAKAKGNALIILDADMTVPPEDLTKFYHCLRAGKGDLVIGSRLIYPLENEAMRFLNILGNKFFSMVFTILLDQPIKDTLCGTKALLRDDYEKITANRQYFGNFDPYGDFDLIFGASKLNLKITEIPIRYKERTYGRSNISRFIHGLLLLRMTLIASYKLKFI